MSRINSGMFREPGTRLVPYAVIGRLRKGFRVSHATATGLVVVLAVSGPAWAADPIIGTWRLNVAESTFSTAMQAVPPKELIEVIREIDGERIEITQNGIQEDGRPVRFRITFPDQGGVGTIIEAEGMEGMTFFETLVSPGNWYATTLRGGKQVIVRHKVVSADGKAKRETAHGTDDRGQPFEQVEVYERIQP